MWKRAASLILDFLVINFIIIPPFSDILTAYAGEGFSSLQATIPGQVYAAIVSIGFVSLLYFSIFQHHFQQTIGMMITNIYVVPKPGFWKSVTRNLFVLPFFPFNLLWIIEPFYLYFRGRRILEKATGTSTVEVSNG